MTREEFIKVLVNNNHCTYPYKEEGDKIIVDFAGPIFLNGIDSLPPNVTFSENNKNVHLNTIKFLPEKIVFSNSGYIFLDSVESIPNDTIFYNNGYVLLRSLIGGWSVDWKGNIKDIGSNRLLNKMISLGLFDKNIK
jgi:hypothetical protein